MPVVRVSWFDGKEHQQKEKVAADITESIVRHTGTDPNYIYVKRWPRLSEHQTGFDKWSPAGLTSAPRVVHGGGRASLATNARPTRWATRVTAHAAC